MKKEQRDKRKNEKEDYRERNSMVAVNIQALVECTCYLIFGILLFYLTYSGKYLKYVTPRMKPYLYGLSVLMFIWTLAEGRFLLIPRYKARIAPVIYIYYSHSFNGDPTKNARRKRDGRI